MAALWQSSWFASHAGPQAMTAWRGVEAQHVVATMRLVDTLAEQAELERILEGSKPALPAAAQAKHFLLSTPFRYRPAHASRFRKAGARGIWYGAATLRTAAAEVAYWRWRFLMDSPALADQALLTPHTFFAAQVQGSAIDLAALPWARQHKVWTHSSDYSATQAVADAARQHGMHWIRYASARDPGGLCAAVLDVQALNAAEPLVQQTWHCKATRHTVLMARDRADRYSWDFT